MCVCVLRSVCLDVLASLDTTEHERNNSEHANTKELLWGRATIRYIIVEYNLLPRQHLRMLPTSKNAAHISPVQ